MINKCLKNQSGFTIVESLVSILILTLALVPVLSVVVSATDISNNIRNNFIAANLAQEGIEVVRSIRDRNWFIDPIPNPPYPLTNPPSGTLIGTWRVQWDSELLVAVGSNPPLLIDANGIYNYTTGARTLFRRRIIIEDANLANPDKDMRVISEVTWVAKGNITRTVRAESHLYNWR